MTTDEVAVEMKISHGSAMNSRIPKSRRRWVPKNSLPDLKVCGENVYETFSQRFEAEGENFLQTYLEVNDGRTTSSQKQSEPARSVDILPRRNQSGSLQLRGHEN